MEDENENHTKHCGVVISLGNTTPLWYYIREQIPEAEYLIVDVTEWLRAPPRQERVKGYFPDDNVVSQIRNHDGFNKAKDACESTLGKYGIALVACKGGNHRAPTVADSMKARGRFVLHATLRTRPSLPHKHVATLVHACVKCSSSIEFYNGLVRESQDPQYKTPLCVGWSSAVNVDGTWQLDTSRPQAGAEVQLLQVKGAESTVMDTTTGHTYVLPVTWLLPKSVLTAMVRSSDAFGSDDEKQ